MVYGFLKGCKGFSMVHGFFVVYGCTNERYGCEFFLCHPPTPIIWGTKRICILQLLSLSETDRILPDRPALLPNIL